MDNQIEEARKFINEFKHKYEAEKRQLVKEMLQPTNNDQATFGNLRKQLAREDKMNNNQAPGLRRLTNQRMGKIDYHEAQSQLEEEKKFQR